MDAFGLELELDRLEATIAGELGDATRALWTATAQDPAAELLAQPPVLLAEATRRTLDAARALPGDNGERATTLWRHALGAVAAVEDPGRRIAVAVRDEAGLRAALVARDATARRLGFADAWRMARAIAGEEADAAPEAGAAAAAAAAAAAGTAAAAAAAAGTAAVAAAAAVGGAGCERLLGNPQILVEELAVVHGLDPRIITIEVGVGDGPRPGRTFVVEPGRDVRIRVWRRPGSSGRGALRVLLHELGHALLAASCRDRPWSLPSRAFDEGVAAWLAGLLEDPAQVGRLLEIDEEAAERLAAAERTARTIRRARLEAAAVAEHAFMTAGGPPPWQDELAWTDPGATWSYAAAEQLRDVFDALHGSPASAGLLSRR